MNISSIDYPVEKSKIINTIESIMIDKSDICNDEHQAFNLLAADLFAGSSRLDEFLFITDGPSDQGIDFYTRIDSSYEIFQCKFPEIDNLIPTDKPISFSQDCVKELKNAFEYLKSNYVQTTVKEDVKLLRAHLRSEDNPNVSFNLCIFGELTLDAKQKYNKFKEENESDLIEINLFEYRDIIEEISLRSTIGKEINYQFNIHKGQILSKSDYCYWLASAKDFYDLFVKYGWSLFDLNVRAELQSSNINKSIIDSLTHDKGIRNFHHLNNGILIFCNSLRKIDKDKAIKLKNFQIINGCQTVLSIYRAYNKISNDPEKMNTFNNNCLIQVKAIIKNKNTQNIMDDIIVSSNNQNPMSPRNLKSNRSEQKRIKDLFDKMPKKWFYQRKDGEFNSLKGLKSFAHFKFRISDYMEGKVYRFLDNKDLAKSWYSFIGFSKDTLMKSEYFENNEMYSNIFLSKSTSTLWKDFLNPDIKLERKNEYFQVGSIPTSEEYLESFLIWKFIKHYAISPSENKKKAIKRGISKGKLKESDTSIKQGDYLIIDNEYMINNIINNSKEIFVEMFSFILGKRYGFGYEVSKKLLNSSTFRQLVTKPDYNDFIKSMKRDNNNILYSIFEFIKHVLKQLFLEEIKFDYIASIRKKTYLARSEFVTRLKQHIINIDSDEGFREVMGLGKWKIPNKSFIDNLPDL